ncbi:hypothetical protein NX794_27330 [Streptomyces sp. LP11]|uniref:Gram-positive cocci surface proteins LPxTG domain-containing protein n=1 Tax=Streptomyces pyxinicus TaxID=2970331 RepID=A0ABT2B8Q8_9ACTN|nr:hypothetical protein [Streptomyces sp. LP11]MCS0604899.1 hypothetical protein [Streptomyces sp. LP11]
MRSPLRPAAAAVAAAAIGIAVPALTAPVAHAGELGPDLVISTLPVASPKPGEVYDKTVIVTNNGTAAARDVVFRIGLSRGLDFPEHVEGCTYSTTRDGGPQALCDLHQTVEPKASVTTRVRFRARPDALLEYVEYGTSPTGAAPGDGFDEANRRLALTADSTADLLAEGDKAAGDPGGEVTLTATLRDAGPGRIQNEESDEQPGLLVRIPAGTTAVQVPGDCAPFGVDAPTGPSEPGHPKYVCWPADQIIEAGQKLDYTFVLKIGKGARDTRGEITASSVYGTHLDVDKNRANDTAYLDVDVTDSGGTSGGSTAGGSTAGGSTGGGSTAGGSTAGGSGDGGSATGGSGTGGGGNAPHGQSTGGTSGTGTSAAAADSTGGVLAGTGSDGRPLLAAGAGAAVVAGGLVLVAVRRRRAV